jgi:hypothetical protein
MEKATNDHIDKEGSSRIGFQGNISKSCWAKLLPTLIPEAEIQFSLISTDRIIGVLPRIIGECARLKYASLAFCQKFP